MNGLECLLDFHLSRFFDWCALSWIGECIVGPFIEEYLKRAYGPLCTLIIAWLEATGDVFQLKSKSLMGLVLTYCFCFFQRWWAHTQFASAESFWLSFFYHACWNAFARGFLSGQPATNSLFHSLFKPLALHVNTTRAKQVNAREQFCSAHLMPRRNRVRPARRVTTRALVVAAPQRQVARPRKNRKRGSKTRSAHPYLIARVNPFLSICSGIRAPDDFGYPSGTGVLRESYTLQVDSTGYTASAFTGFSNPYIIQPNSTTSGIITWTSGGTVASAQNGSLTQLATTYRTVAWGLKISADSSFTNSQGHVWVAHVPLNLNSALYNGLPTTEAQWATCPLSEKYSVTQLATESVIVAARPYDDGIYRFRSDNMLAANSNIVESATGWCSIAVFVAGGIATTTTLNIETIMHVEYLQAGSSLYGFVDAVPGPYEPAVMVAASKADESLPTGLLENVVSTTENVVSLTTRLVNAGSRLLPMVATGLRAAGALKKLTGFSRSDPSIPRLGWDEMKY